jgi:hypothetical protein
MVGRDHPGPEILSRPINRFGFERADFETQLSSPTSVWMGLGRRKKELNLEVRHEVVTKASFAD